MTNTNLQTIEQLPSLYKQFKIEVQKQIFGQDDVIEKIFCCLLCQGHVLLVGVPGLAKTTLVQCIAQTLGLPSNRIQFTPDLMPSDILGNEILTEDKQTGARQLSFHRGPIFTNILLADEINRTPPKTQSALLQAMQEKVVSIYGHTYKLPPPFMVLATQNPLEHEGTYPLPEAQLDRFLMSILIDYPDVESEYHIIANTSVNQSKKIEAVFNSEKLLSIQAEIDSIAIPEHVIKYVVDLVRKTRPQDSSFPVSLKNLIEWGAGPRAAQHLVKAARARALIFGRPVPSIDDIQNLAYPILNHRILLSFSARAEGVSTKKIIDTIL